MRFARKEPPLKASKVLEGSSKVLEGSSKVLEGSSKVLEGPRRFLEGQFQCSGRSEVDAVAPRHFGNFCFNSNNIWAFYMFGADLG